jgi:DNA repair protein RadC
VTTKSTNKLPAPDILALLQDIAYLKQEHFVCLSLDSGGEVITRRTVVIGTVDSVMAHPREIFAGAIADYATNIIVAHNHPSGEVEPSKHDVETTQQLVAAGQLLGIHLHYGW